MYQGKEVWKEEPSVADSYRKEYVEGLERFIAEEVERSRESRRLFMPPEVLIHSAPEYRKRYVEMLGIPDFSKDPLRVERQRVGEDDFSEIFRLKIYLAEVIPFYAMLLLPKGQKKKVPLVVFQHGGHGTPELAADFHGKNSYNSAVRRIAAHRVAILLPQLMLWTRKGDETHREHPIPYDRVAIDKDLKRFGYSITGFEIGGIMRCIDYALTMDEIDAERIGMTGLSYGGYFTLHTMAADTRIRAGYAVGAFTDRDAYAWNDWTYFGGSHMFHDAEVGALCAPRKLAVQIGKADPVFDYSRAHGEMERLQDYYNAYGASEKLKFSVWEGGHTYSDDNECFDYFLSELLED